MKLITNESNLNALKIVIASKVTRKSMDIIKDSADNLFKLLKAPKTAPQLILDSGTYIFSSNAAAKFLFPPKDKECSIVNCYLDLESALMQPLTTSCTSKARDSVKKCFEDVLKHLDQELSSKPYLAGTEMTVGDVVIWCTLYPIFTDEVICSEFLGQKASLKIWFESVERNAAVQEALKQYPIPKGLSCLDSLVSIQSVKNSASSSFFPNDSSNSPEKSVVLVTDEEKKAASVSFNTKVKGSSKKKVHPVLPVPGEKNILITSALPYVNNVPHLGNIIGCVLSGDVFARYCRLRGYNTLYISGTDEYGTATETKALEEGLSPREICDKFFKIHDSIYKWFNINFDFFGRTTTPQQTEICQDIFRKVYNNGFISADSVEQLLCEKCDRYLADRFVEGTCPRCAFVDARGDQCDGCGHLINAVELIAPRCKICKQTPVLRNSKQFFLDLPKIEPMLKAWIEKSWVHWSHNAREISKAWLNDGLKPRCITRDLKWGIPVPLEGFQNKVFYVWFDAPIGYISITKLYTEEWRKWWMPEKETHVDLYQFMAKDNVPFHSVMFPASLLSTKENYVMVNHIFATEYLNYEDGKFSKSRGIGVFGNDAQNTGIPSDVWRFYLLYVRPESQDSSFSWVDLALKHNSELLSVLGNFINRALMFCEKSFKAVTPNIELTDEDCELMALVNREVSGYISVVEKGKLREGIRHLLAVARLGNQFMQSSQPWVLIKGSEAEKKRCETVIGLSINLACLLAQLLDPYMPQTADVIRKQLNCPPEVITINDKFTLLLPPGHKIGKPFPLFAKIEDEQVEKLKSQFSGRQKSDSPTAAEKAKTPGQLAGNDVSSLEAAVAAQGDLVRKMKADGKSKTEWGPEVSILLDLKNKLAKVKEGVKEGNGISNPTSQTTATVEEMEEKVKKQGDLVRKLKESGAEKSLWQPEVTVLLDLKKKLAEIKGEPLPPPSGKKNKKK